jgi:hypothetical protein
LSRPIAAFQKFAEHAQGMTLAACRTGVWLSEEPDGTRP